MLQTSTRQLRRARRAGFTLVELLVMAAVSVIIMAVLANVFSTGIDAIRQIRAQGEMMDQLRSAGEVIKRDLGNPPFQSNPIPGTPGDRSRLSMYRQNDNLPLGGYFRVASPASTSEGPDYDAITSYVATNHSLQFTAIASGNADANQYTATMMNAAGNPIGVATSPAAEIAYFLVPDPGRSTGAGAVNGANYGPQTTYLLIRRQRLVALNTQEQTRLNTYIAGDVSPGDVLSVSGGNVNRLTDLVTNNRMAQTQLGGVRYGDDILLSNVLSFEVKVIGDKPTYTGDTDYPYTNTGAVVDTGAGTTIGTRIRGFQIRLRIYDTKMQQARQITFVLDM